MTVILIILALYCALFIYEIGHIIAIKINKLNAEEIVVGFGPKLFCIIGEQTKYIVKLIPLGSYTKIGEEKSLDGDNRGFYEVSCIKRIFTMASGIIFSFIVMIIIQSIIGCITNTGINLIEVLSSGFDYCVEYVFDFYSAICKIAISKEISLWMLLKMMVSNGIDTLGIGVGLFLYLLVNILGIFVAINIFPLPIFAGGQVIIEIIKGVFKVDIIESKLTIVNIISLVLSIVFFIYLLL